MPKISFTVPPEISSESLVGSVPLEVHDSQFRPIDTGGTRLSDGIDLAPGFYNAQATLPDGTMVSGAFKVPARGNSRVVLCANLPEGMRGSGQTEFDAGAAFEPLHVERRYRFVDANVMMDRAVNGEWGWLKGSLLSYAGSLPPKALQVEGPAGITTVALPAGPGETLRLRFDAVSGIRDVPHIEFTDTDVELLLRYMHAGMVSAVQRLTTTSHALAVECMQEPSGYPIAATVAAYVFLRIGPIEPLERYAERLFREAPWLPDGAAIFAEYLCRKGRHEEAFRVLLELERRGAPFFSSGLSYAVDRLDYYRASPPAGIDAAARAAAERIDLRLSTVAALADFDRPILTYADPGKGITIPQTMLPATLS